MTRRFVILLVLSICFCCLTTIASILIYIHLIPKSVSVCIYTKLWILAEINIFLYSFLTICLSDIHHGDGRKFLRFVPYVFQKKLTSCSPQSVNNWVDRCACGNFFISYNKKKRNKKIHTPLLLKHKC